MRFSMRWILTAGLVLGIAGCNSPTDSAPNPDDDDREEPDAPDDGQTMLLTFGSDPVLI